MEMQREAVLAGMVPNVLTKPIDNVKLFCELAHLQPFRDLLSL